MYGLLIMLLAILGGWQSAVQHTSLAGGKLLRCCPLPSGPCDDPPCDARVTPLARLPP